MLGYSGALIAAGLLINIVVSVVVALVPLLYGRNRGAATLGIAGFVVTVVLGILLGFVIAVLSAIIFFVAIWATTRSRRTAATV
jgi:hypothetical protein